MHRARVVDQQVPACIAGQCGKNALGNLPRGGRVGQIDANLLELDALGRGLRGEVVVGAACHRDKAGARS